MLKPAYCNLAATSISAARQNCTHVPQYLLQLPPITKMMSNLNRPKKNNEIIDNNETLSVATIKAGNRSEKKVTWRDHQGKEPQEVSG